MVAFFFLVPLVLVFWMSLNDWKLLGTPSFNFPDNYKAVPKDDLLKGAIGFTLKYTVITTVVLSAVAMGLALLVQERRPATGLLRTVFFLPGAVGFAAASLLFYAFYSDGGPIDDVLMRLHIISHPVGWLSTPGKALFSTVMMVIWRFAGFN